MKYMGNNFNLTKNIFLILIVFSCFGWAQIPKEFIRPEGKERPPDLGGEGRPLGDSLSFEELSSRVTFKAAKISDYHYFSHLNDSVMVDTTLSIRKDWKFNYLRKDEFDLMPFANIGQTYNTLSYDLKRSDLMPGFGASAKQFDFKGIKDMQYYQVATPFTELAFKTAFSQGQLLDALFAANTSRKFNYSIGYKGLRSLGKYQHVLSSSGFFRFTAHYTNPKNRYQFKAHVAMQDAFNQENGGISDEDLVNFENGDAEFLDRSLFDPLFEDAENKFTGKRFYLNQTYTLVRPKDSLSTSSLKLGNVTYFDQKKYEYAQTNPYEGYGLSSSVGDIKDQNYLSRFYTDFNVGFTSQVLGSITGSISFNDYTFGHDNVFLDENNTVSEEFGGSLVALEGTYTNRVGKFEMQTQAGAIVTGNQYGYNFDGSLAFNWSDKFRIKAGAYSQSIAPNFNVQYYRSDYLNYNWNTSFSNQKTNGLYFVLKAPSVVEVEADASLISDFLFFGKTADLSEIKPMQYDESIVYVRIKASREDQYGNFVWNNTLRYQNAGDQTVLNVPDWQLRSTFYYSDDVFNKAMFLQTGITLNVFSEYYMNGYDPVLSEFFSQNNRKYGGFPRLDFFVNAKVRQTRIFLKAEHFNSAWTGYNFYSAPNHPYRDFTVRFGLVWNFFL